MANHWARPKDRNRGFSHTKALVGFACLATILAALSLADVPPYPATPAESVPGITSHTIRHEDSDLAYVEAGTPGKPLVVFIHGTPGAWQAFQGFMQHPRLLANTHMLAIDRPGLGNSASSGTQPAFAYQAKAVAQLFKHNQGNQKAVVVGHSLGGSIAYRVALDYPDSAGAILAISSSISPKLGRPRWYNRMAALPVVRWFVTGDLRVANDEIMALAKELTAMEPGTAELGMPVTIVQGGKDKLVRPANAKYAEQHLSNAQLRIVQRPEAGHFLIWEDPEMIVREILHLTDALAPDSNAGDEQ